jgi:diguanylate cyclase (GGDEF)-like protein
VTAGITPRRAARLARVGPWQRVVRLRRARASAPIRKRIVTALCLSSLVPALALLYTTVFFATGLPPEQRGYLPALGLCALILMAGGTLAIWDLAREADRANQRLRELSLLDDLTGLYNRRYCDLRLREELARAERSAQAFCLVLIDLDYFKGVNDRFGHDMGDLVLREACRVIQGQSRASTAVCRYGGDELAIILPDTPWTGALVFADRVRGAVARASFPHGEGLTVSLGVGAYPEDARTPEGLFKAADVSLYAAKAGGRNRTGA